ncbi:MAG: hypothetical protein V4592_22655 [Bacteroidota bacterium]
MKAVFDHSYSVITFATNKLSYVKFALNCAQSVLLHNDINIYIVSNLNFQIPAPIQKNVKIIKATDEHAALGIGIKLYIDQYAPTEKTLFIDSDCLCYGSLQPLFDAFNGKDVSVVGAIVDAAEWCGPDNAAVIDKEFGIKQLPRFNGGVYFISKTETAKNIFDFARGLVPQYDSMGFGRLKNNSINEEGLLAIAMVKYNQSPITDNGRYMTDLFTDFYPRGLNVLNGIIKLTNPQAGRPRHRPWYPAQYSPIVLHFGGNNLKSVIYTSQTLLLKLYSLNIPKNIATIFVNVFIHIPYKGIKWLTG